MSTSSEFPEGTKFYNLNGCPAAVQPDESRDFQLLVWTSDPRFVHPFALDEDGLELKRAAFDALRHEVHAAEPYVFRPAIHRDWDSGNFCAELTVFALGGMYVYNVHAAEPAWTFFPPQSPECDSYRQQIYRQFDGERLSPEDPRRKELPPVPPWPRVPDGGWPDSDSYRKPDGPTDPRRYPALAAYLKSRQGATVEVYLVLYEDTYESSFGDGKYIYVDSGFVQKRAAERYAAESRAAEKWFDYTVRPLRLRWVEGGILAVDLTFDSFESWHLYDALAALDRHLGTSKSESP